MRVRFLGPGAGMTRIVGGLSRECLSYPDRKLGMKRGEDGISDEDSENDFAWMRRRRWSE